MKMDLNIILMRAEELFYKYCRKSVVDCFQVVDLDTKDVSWYQQASQSNERILLGGTLLNFMSRIDDFF